MTSKSNLVRILRVIAEDPIKDNVDRLNEFQPRAITGYPSVVKVLAYEQMAGRLKISPEKIGCSAEVLTKDLRDLIHEVWGTQPFNSYGTTETAIMASECTEHNGMHIFEDTVIVEVVDKDNKPVKPGEYGYKILVTVLFNHTLPLIRYEISDSVLLSDKKCACGLSYRLIEDVQGRFEDIIYMAGCSGNSVPVQPHFFDNELEFTPITGWQIVQETERRLKILITGPKTTFDEEKFKSTMVKALESLGINEPEVTVERVDEFPRTAAGKTHHIKALSSPKKTD